MPKSFLNIISGEMHRKMHFKYECQVYENGFLLYKCVLLNIFVIWLPTDPNTKMWFYRLDVIESVIKSLADKKGLRFLVILVNWTLIAILPNNVQDFLGIYTIYTSSVPIQKINSAKKAAINANFFSVSFTNQNKTKIS